MEGEGGRILETNPLTTASKDLNTELEELVKALEQEQALNTELTVKLSEYKGRTPSSREEMSKLKDDLKGEREKSKRMWRMNCEQVKMHDELMMEKESEIERFREQLRLLRKHSPREDSLRSRHQSARKHSPLSGEHDAPSTEREPVMNTRIVRQGKAQPIDPFIGENLEVILNDWLMSLQRASAWNGWTEEELLIQLAGHLRGRALQEWNLLAKSEKSTYKDATRALNSCLEHSSKKLAAQDFRHFSQKEHESVSDFISHFEKTFQLAYGHDSMTIETRHTLLHSQL